MDYTLTIVTRKGKMFELHYNSLRAAEKSVEKTLAIFGGSFTIERNIEHAVQI